MPFHNLGDKPRHILYLADENQQLGTHNYLVEPVTYLQLLERGKGLHLLHQ
jgi:hypothetical protein